MLRVHDGMILSILEALVMARSYSYRRPWDLSHRCVVTLIHLHPRQQNIQQRTRCSSHILPWLRARSTTSSWRTIFRTFPQLPSSFSRSIRSRLLTASVLGVLINLFAALHLAKSYLREAVTETWRSQRHGGSTQTQLCQVVSILYVRNCASYEHYITNKRRDGAGRWTFTASAQSSNNFILIVVDP